MKVKDFLYLCSSRRLPNIVSEIDKNLDKYKIITKHFIYPCNFDKYGRCSVHRGPMCCCANCGINVGYLDKIRPVGNVKQVSEIIKKYARLYNRETGFWRKSKGCALPRNMRSATCVGFICSERRKKFTFVNGWDAINFLYLLKKYNHLSKREKRYLYKFYIKISNKQKAKGGKNGKGTNSR